MPRFHDRIGVSAATLAGLLKRVIAVVYVVGVCGCSVPALDKSLLTAEPCAAPCWCGIMPGETAQEAALHELSRCPWAKAGSIRQTLTTSSDGTDELIVGWDHRARLLGPEITRNRNRAHIRDGKVELIRVWLDYSLTLNDVVDLFGPPEGVYAIRGYGHPSFEVVFDYPGRGLSFEAFLPRVSADEYYVGDDRGIIYPYTKVSTVYYYAPTTLESALRDAFVVYPDRLDAMLQDEQEWRGFGEVDLAYYHR